MNYVYTKNPHEKRIKSAKPDKPIFTLNSICSESNVGGNDGGGAGCGLLWRAGVLVPETCQTIRKVSIHAVCPRSGDILYSKLLYKMGHYFLDTQ